MKAIIALGFLAAAANAHYTFPGLIYNGKTEADWSFVRETTNKYSHGPVENVNDAQLRCYTAGSGSQGAGTKAVKAGDTVGFRVDSDIGHPGPLQFYMAKAPSGATAESFDGSGNVWFKIYQDGPSFAGGQITWPSAGKKEVSVQIPRCLPDGYYLLRAEHIALHSAGSVGGAQFYIGCAQLHVTGGTGTVTPSGVAFPGAYKATDPGILFQLYYPVPTSYTNPGPRLMTC
ncbi:hypothetical protein PG985_015658 [Apiospora marii]|uniref:lytic cellulose monooxygenase (C4-dehydrogenating) n=1 Tax=Apiospora marii TaxID=335849 RepID=A0ABR1S4S2_9PEZI